MALMNCPKCGKRVSSYAPNCPVCGYPISIIDENTSEADKPNSIFVIHGKRYDLKEIGYYMNNGEKIRAIRELRAKTSLNLSDAVNFVEQTNWDADIFRTHPEENPTGVDNNINNKTTLIRCPVCGKSVSSNATTCPNCGEPIDTIVRCPNCGSKKTRVISGSSKAGSILLWGVFAANKVLSKYECLDCYHKF